MSSIIASARVINKIIKKIFKNNFKDRTRDPHVHTGNIKHSITDSINVKMEMWDTHESTRQDDLIRPRREEILKLKKALREKYPREEAQFHFDDGESETQSYATFD